MFNRRWRTLLLALFIVVVGVACAADPKVTVRDAAPPDVRSLGLPRNDAGALVLVASPQVELVVDPTMKTPAQTMRGCRFWLTACTTQNDNRLDACMEQSPPCRSQRPWEVDEQCCPAPCVDRYREHRGAGKQPSDALLATFSELECFPRLAAYRRGEAP